MSMDEMLKDFKDLAEMQAFAEAQTKTIIDLNKKLRKIEEENLHLKKVLEDSSAIMFPIDKEFSENMLLGSDEETIAKIQLGRLKETSFSRELTLEECRKVEIYTKVIGISKTKPSKIFEIQKSLDNAELLKLVDETGNK